MTGRTSRRSDHGANRPHLPPLPTLPSTSAYPPSQYTRKDSCIFHINSCLPHVFARIFSAFGVHFLLYQTLPHGPTVSEVEPNILRMLELCQRLRHKAFDLSLFSFSLHQATRSCFLKLTNPYLQDVELYYHCLSCVGICHPSSLCGISSVCNVQQCCSGMYYHFSILILFLISYCMEPISFASVQLNINWTTRKQR